MDEFYLYFLNFYFCFFDPSHFFCPCSVIGAFLIMVGLYLVLWGKTEEKNIASVGVAKDEDTLKKHLLNDPESRDTEEGADESNTA